MFKGKARKLDTGQKADPPTIQVDETLCPTALQGSELPREDTFGRRTREKVKGVFSHLHPSAVDQATAESGREMEEERSPTIGAIDREAVQVALKEAARKVRTMHTKGGCVQKATDRGTQESSAFDTEENVLHPLKVFDSVVKGLGDVHPYAKIALSVLSWASQAIIAQTNRDKSIQDLQAKIAGIYKLMIEDGRLEKIISMKDVLTQASQVMLECAKFIQAYSQPTFLNRLGKGIFSNTAEAVAQYSNVLDGLVQQFHGTAMRDVLIATRNMLEDLKQLGDNQHVNLVTYTEGAGLDTTKACLDGTREEILDYIMDWIDDPDINAPRIQWLFGPAGTGKSAIAHTIGRCMKDSGALASFFCFEKGDVKRYTKLFTTISRDLAGRDLRFKQGLANIVARDPSIATTVDVVQQWEKLVMEPISVISGSIVGHLVIVIDALDESGDGQSRKHILDILTKQAAALPSNIRILVTSRPIQDIRKVFEAADHITRMSMDDIPMSSTTRDIHSYISCQLSDTDHRFSASEIARLATRSDGLFEWARLACNYIKSSKAGLSEKERFDDLMSRTEREGVELLDNMYNVILKEILGEQPQERVLARFRSVMRHVLFTVEPLPLDALIAMHRSIQNENNYYDAEVTILRPMASVLAGVHNQTTPIRPLHSSFHEFLTDHHRGGQFFVNEADAHHDLALSTLHIMQRELRFNICRLESSYLRNSEVSDMAQRIKLYISPQLSYSCHFLANHIEGTPFNNHVADALQAILGNEWTMYWIETLSALQSVSILPKSLTLISGWLENKEGYELAVAAAKDGIQLIWNFGTIISESIPHLYLSTLPFLPKNSVFSGSFSLNFPFIAKLVSGKLATWPPVECLLRGHEGIVMSVAFSPDRKLAVSVK